MRVIFNLIAVTSVLLLSSCGEPSKSNNEITEAQPNITGPLKLVREESSLSFTTIKSGMIAEVHSFKSLDAQIASNGAAELTIVLDSVDTQNEIRDPRMREFLFETATYPYAKITANLDANNYNTLPLNMPTSSGFPFTLDLHGVQAEMDASVWVTRLGVDKVSVSSAVPIIIDASDFALLDGVEKLRELANLPEITPVVPVTFSLVFQQ